MSDVMENRPAVQPAAAAADEFFVVRDTHA